MPSESCGSATAAQTSSAGRSQASTEGRNAGDLGQRGDGVGRPARRGSRPGSRRGWRPPSRRARRRWRPRGGRRARARAGPRRRTPRRRGSAAWPPITPTRCLRWIHAVERLVDRVVVQRPGQRVVGVAPRLGPGVGAGVQRARVRRGVVQLLGGVEPRPVDVDRRDRQRRQHQRARPLEPLLDVRPEGAAEERRSGHPQPRPAPRRARAGRPWRTRQPLSRVAPAATRRSKSASDSTWTTRPRLRLTSAT